MDRAQKNGEDGEESSRTEPNFMDSLIPKQTGSKTDRQTDGMTDRKIENIIPRQSNFMLKSET